MRPHSQLSVSCVRADAHTRTHARNWVAHRRTSIAAHDRRAHPRRWTLRTGSGFPDSRVHEGSRCSLARTPGQAYLILSYLSLALSWRERGARLVVTARCSLSRRETRGLVGSSDSRPFSLSVLLSRTPSALRDEGRRCSASSPEALSHIAHHVSLDRVERVRREESSARSCL